MNTGPELTFSQGKHTNGQKTYENVLSVTKLQGNENQNEIPPHTYHGGDYQKDKRQQVLVKDVEKTDLSPTVVRNVN